MKFVTISDVHVQSPTDERYNLLLKFLTHPKIADMSDILFLGDIFDLMAGNWNKYHSDYKEFFNIVKSLLKSGKNIYYFEGNHDLHLKKLFQSAVGPFNDQFHYVKWSKVLEFENKKFLFTHGDFLIDDDLIYFLYRKTIAFRPLSFFADYFMPHRLFDKVGKAASKSSKQRNYSGRNSNTLKAKIRESISKKAYDCDYLIAGHTHIEDNIILENSGKTLRYLNAGFYSETKKNIIFDGKEISLTSLA